MSIELIIILEFFCILREILAFKSFVLLIATHWDAFFPEADPPCVRLSLCCSLGKPRDALPAPIFLNSVVFVLFHPPNRKAVHFMSVCPKLSRLIIVILGNKKRDTVSSVVSEDIFMSMSGFWRGPVVLHTFTILTSLALLHYGKARRPASKNLSDIPVPSPRIELAVLNVRAPMRDYIWMICHALKGMFWVEYKSISVDNRLPQKVISTHPSAENKEA